MMKLSRLARASVASSTLLPGIPKPDGCIIRPTVSSADPHHTPLCLRPLAFRATLSELKKWQIWAKNKISSVGSSFLYLDHGPDAYDLRRDLHCLIRNTIQQPPKKNMNNHRDDDAAAMRASLDDLYQMWEQRIEERKPISYAMGFHTWLDLKLMVQPGLVYIPRLHTTFIVHMLEAIVNYNQGLTDGVWADLGTGCGALAIALAPNICTGTLIATDLSPAALEVASYNVHRHNLQDRVEIRQGSWFEPLKDLQGQVSVLVSTPPCVPTLLIDCLPAETSKHEPRLALDGGPNGLNHLIHLCHGAASILKPGGLFMFQTHGEQQGLFLEDYIHSKMRGTFRDVQVESDFFLLKRLVMGYRA